MIAAPRPWTTRMAISIPGSGATPASSDAAVKKTIPIANRRRRPYRSPSLPAVSMLAA
jgi:hypothetical protein